jgi:hypothetical protein
MDFAETPPARFGTAGRCHFKAKSTFRPNAFFMAHNVIRQHAMSVSNRAFGAKPQVFFCQSSSHLLGSKFATFSG